MAEVLQVEKRESHGKRNARRLRQSGKLPAILYGHGEASVSLSIPADQVDAAVSHGAKVVGLEGAADGQALIQELQWDAFSTHVLHLDLLRVSAGERITIEVPIELRGESPGAKEGGLVEVVMHSIVIETTVGNVPESLSVNINELELGGSLSTDAIIDLPTDAKVLVAENTSIVHCVAPRVEEEPEELPVGAAQPEVIGEKPAEEAPEE